MLGDMITAAVYLNLQHNEARNIEGPLCVSQNVILRFITFVCNIFLYMILNLYHPGIGDFNPLQVQCWQPDFN
jgi:hypothetical protein